MTEKKVLKVGLDSAAPYPMHSDYNSETFEGFEVDLLSAITEHLGLEVEYQVSLWQNILERLFKGELDLICSAVTVTPSRKHILEFSDPYLYFRLCAVISAEEKLNDINDLRNKTIGVRIAAEAEKYVLSHFPESNMYHAETNHELYRMLLSKNIDVVIDDSPIAGGFTEKNKQLKVGLYLPSTESQYAIAMKKGDTTLKKMFNDALKHLKVTGVYDEIYAKWFTGVMH